MNITFESNILKNLLFVFIAVMMFSTSTLAQTASEYKAGNEGWLVSIDEAYKQSQETGLPIMANFTGSDWCGWCKRLTKTVFSKDEFKKWAKDNVILLELDFPRRTKLPIEIQKQNASLKQAFKVRGFPAVWVFDLYKDGESQQFNISALGKTGYTKTASEFISDVEKMIAQRG